MKGPDAAKVEKMFDTISGDYDKLNHILSLGIDRQWRRRALKRIIDNNSSQNILDIACGTGDFSIEIARKSRLDTKVTAIDISDGMLAVMRTKVAKAGLEEKISISHGNSEMMGFDDDSFDCVTIGFGIRNFEHREKALKEILRVLKPGASLVILELSEPSSPAARKLYELYFLHILPRIGSFVSHDKAAYRYLPASVIKFPKKDEWMKTMGECGYSDVSHKPFTFGICRMYIGKKQQ